MKKPDVKVVILGDMNVGKTSLLHRYTERRFKDTVSTVGGAFFLKQWGHHHISIWDTAGREQFHGLGSMYCRGAAAVILVYDVTQWQSYAELENRFFSLTDTANTDCIFALVGNKADLTDLEAQTEAGEEPEHPPPSSSPSSPSPASLPSAPSSPSSSSSPPSPASPASSLQYKQVSREDAVALYGRVLRYKGLDEKSSLPAERMCFETSAKTGYNVDLLFETVFDMLLPSILKKRNAGENSTVDLEAPHTHKKSKPGCCA